jgi:hypothetical protein
MGDKGVKLNIYSDQAGVFDPPEIVLRRTVGEWSELRNKVGCGRNMNTCPIWRLRLKI